MKFIQVSTITTLLVISLAFFSTDAFANHRNQRPGWADAQVAQLGPGGTSVNPGEVIREETDVLQDSIRQAIATGGDIGGAIKTAVARFLQAVFSVIGLR